MMNDSLAAGMPAASAVAKAARIPRYSWKRAIVFAMFLFVMSASIMVMGRYYIVGMMPPEEVALNGSWVDAGLKTFQDKGSVAFRDHDRLNILCLGVDYNYDNKDQHHTKWSRSDTMFVLSIDKDAETLNLLAIPRDLRVELPGYGFDKINAAYAHEQYGDLKLAQATVENLLGVKMDHYIVIKEYAAQAIVNAVGGVTVNVEKDMDYDDNWGHLHIHLKKGIQRLNGEQALGFVRFRHDEEGDRGRIKRQQQFIDALLKELKKPSYTTYNAIAKTFHDNLTTDLTVADMIDIGNVYKNFDRKKMKTAKIDGSDTEIDGISYIVPDDTEKQRVVARMLINPTSFAAEDVKIEVLNASDVSGAARAFADVLAQRGYNIVNIDTAPSKVRETYIEDHRNLPEAQQNLQQIMGQTRVVDGRDHVSPTAADITVIIGQDWRTRYKAYEQPANAGTAAR